MKLFVRRRGVRLPEPFLGYLERRIRLALGRFVSKVTHATVHLADVNGPRGGVDKRCTIDVRIRGAAPVVARDAGTEIREAVDRAIARLSRAVERASARRRWTQTPRALSPRG